MKVRAFIFGVSLGITLVRIAQRLDDLLWLERLKQDLENWGKDR